jgi:hypothetical protein
VVIVVNDEHRETLAQVVEELQCAGLNVEQVMESIGTIAGSVDLKNFSALSQVTGIAHVEPARRCQVLPPTENA